MAKNPRQLPLVIDIPKPCPANWEAMPGDARVRHCAVCDKDVHALSELSEASTVSLLQRGDVCVRLQVAADGAVVHRDQVRGKRAARVVATAALVALAACTSAEPSVNPSLADHGDAGAPTIAGSVAVMPVAATEPVPVSEPVPSAKPRPSASSAPAKPPPPRPPRHTMGILRLR